MVQKNKNITMEKLSQLGAGKLADKVAWEAKLSSQEKQKLFETASTSLSFKARHLFHQISCDKQGITYYMKNGGPFTHLITCAEIEKFKKKSRAEKEIYIANLNAQYQTQENIWKGVAGEQTSPPKEMEKKPEKETILFNQLIDGLMEKIPATTTNADSITHNLWWCLATEVANGLVESDESLEDIHIIDQDDIRSIEILDDSDILHEIVVNKKGIMYRIIEEKKEEKEKKEFFKEYQEIVRDYLEKKRNV